MCYDNYPENNKYHRKKIYKQPKVYFICRIFSAKFVLNVQYVRTPIFKLF